MQSDPELAKQVYSLYSGPEFKRDDLVNETIRVFFGRSDAHLCQKRHSEERRNNCYNN